MSAKSQAFVALEDNVWILMEAMNAIALKDTG